MLELSKILRDIDDLGREKAESVSGIEAELATAAAVVSVIASDVQAARDKIASAKTSWLTASFDGSPDQTIALPHPPDRHCVVAVDGSQIVPDRHEIALCYLLNAASVTIQYGTGARPTSRTVPTLRYREDDLFESCGGKRTPVTGKLIDIRRTLAESAEMEYALEMAASSGVPVVALWDGSLIRWSIENEPEDYKKRVLEEYLRLFETARRLRIPIAGYISDPGSRDVANSLKVMLCDQTPTDCDKCSYKDSEIPPPCDKIRRLTDCTLHRRRLKNGSRSVLYTSSSRILREYGEHTVRAFYMDAGREIARVEIPEWVAEDPEMLALTHAVCFDQASKGRGYPVALSEAHEHAVVRGPERAAFYDLLERSFIKHGARVSFSLKRMSKGY